MGVAVKLRSLTARRAAIGHSIVRCWIRQHPCTARRKNLFTRFVNHSEHGIGQVTAQDFHIGFGIKLSGVKNDQMRHEKLSV
jgi:hypothetical protein